MKKEDVINRLLLLGYEYDASKDSSSLDFSISKTKWHILNVTNCVDIPEGLTAIAIDMSCAEFLKIKKGFNQLDEISFDNIAKAIKMGDTDITFSDEDSPEQKFDKSIEYLLTGHEEDFARYRKLVW